MTAKYEYFITINRPVLRLDYLFSYAQTSDIQLGIEKNRASFSAFMGKDYSMDLSAAYLTNLIKEGVKKAVLVHLLKRSVPLCIKSVSLEVKRDGMNLASAVITGQIILYSLIEEKLRHLLPSAWGETELINQVLADRKANQGSRTAAFMAYLCSRSKKYELERFQFQWMALNGMYSFLMSPREGKKRVSDREKMSHLAVLKALGNNTMSENERNSICPEIMKLVMNTQQMETVAAQIIEENPCEFAEEVEHKLQEIGSTLSVYGFLLLDFATTFDAMPFMRTSRFH